MGEGPSALRALAHLLQGSLRAAERVGGQDRRPEILQRANGRFAWRPSLVMSTRLASDQLVQIIFAGISTGMATVLVGNALSQTALGSR